jgi:4-amino-4-deoxy-L-arabinose transferase-like glycosyltransferase
VSSIGQELSDHDEPIVVTAMVHQPETLTVAPLVWFCEMRRRHPLLVVGTLALIALFVGLIARTLAPTAVRADNSDYDAFYKPVADSLLRGEGSTINGRAAVRYPPGFPVLLAGAIGFARLVSLPDAFGEAALSLLALVISSLTLFALSEQIHGGAWALVSYLLWIFCPWVAYLVCKPLSDLPFCCFLFAIVWMLCRLFKLANLPPILSLITGVLIGCSMLIRPMGLFLVPLAVVLVLALGRTLRLRMRVAIGGLICIGSIIAVLPWELWVYQKAHEVIPLSTGAGPSIRDGLAFAWNSQASSAQGRQFVKKYRQRIAVPARAQQVSTDALNNYPRLVTTGGVVRFLSTELRENPDGTIELYLVKAARSWYASDAQTHEGVVLGIQLVLLIMIAGGVWGSWNIGGYCRVCTLLCLSLVLYFWAMTTLVLSILRYMTPAMGLLFLLVPGWKYFLNRWRVGIAPSALQRESLYSYNSFKR